MRRKNLQVTDLIKVKAFLRTGHVINTAMHDGDYPYVVPTNYGFQFDEDGLLHLYLHGAPEGKKRDLIAKDGHVAFSIVAKAERYDTPDGELSNNGYAYQTIMGTGNASLVTDLKEKREALELILAHELGSRDDSLKPADVEYTGVIRIDVTGMTAKEATKDKN